MGTLRAFHPHDPTRHPAAWAAVTTLAITSPGPLWSGSVHLPVPSLQGPLLPHLVTTSGLTSFSPS